MIVIWFTGCDEVVLRIKIYQEPQYLVLKSKYSARGHDDTSGISSKRRRVDGERMCECSGNCRTGVHRPYAHFSSPISFARSFQF
jgi:hypothetical protein